MNDLSLLPLLALAADKADFDAWAEKAHDCDWCDGCGGGFLREAELERQLADLGFSSWEQLDAAVAEQA